ncbi:hypothetical protein MNV49_002379 [Pseudohyphozyma bogoriensis]|nr:hypothetical protein MNV49_002379 [Pseudohyphozyma bogoriensis]
MPLNVVEASISDLISALTAGSITSVELVALYLQRIAYYDRHGLTLNSIPVLNEHLFEQAAASDAKRRKGGNVGALEGVPITIKDSYAAKGMTLAAGSPAFEHLVASGDAFTVELLKKAGALIIGRTNMPPMACGGMQRGLYGRAESPYNSEYLTAAFGSGSSNGSATATAASFGALGLGSETVSSGRSPASNNGLVTYTPSRGLLSARGIWPLYPTCDVMMAHTRTMDDHFALLDVIAQEDPITATELWRDQKFITFPSITSIRPNTYFDLAKTAALKGKRFAIPKMYIGKGDIPIRPSILKLWEEARKAIEGQGGEVVETDFSVVERYETEGLGKPGYLSDTWHEFETTKLMSTVWNEFLELNADPACDSLDKADWTKVFPKPPGAVEDKNLGRRRDFKAIVGDFKKSDASAYDEPTLEENLKALEQHRKTDLEDWMDEHGFDAVVFPANSDIGKANSDTNEESSVHTWSNGTLYSSGNRVIRHLGIPTVSVSMGVTEDIGMPVNITFAGKAYSDNTLLSMAYSFEAATKLRQAPTLTPALPLTLPSRSTAVADIPAPVWEATVELSSVSAGKQLVKIETTCSSSKLEAVVVTVNGVQADVDNEQGVWNAQATVDPANVLRPAEIAVPPFGSATVMVLAYFEGGLVQGKLLHA